MAYLLRLWRVGKEGEAAWRASLEDAHTGERQGFTNLATLLAFLEAETERSESAASTPPGPRAHG